MPIETATEIRSGIVKLYFLFGVIAQVD
jgi:hypothetical protein